MSLGLVFLIAPLLQSSSCLGILSRCNTAAYQLLAVVLPVEGTHGDFGRQGRLSWGWRRRWEAVASKSMETSGGGRCVCGRGSWGASGRGVMWGGGSFTFVDGLDCAAPSAVLGKISRYNIRMAAPSCRTSSGRDQWRHWIRREKHSWVWRLC